MQIFSPFDLMICTWSDAVAVANVFRPYQDARTVKTRAKEPIRS